MSKLKCAIYARVSTDKQGDSIENQVSQALEYLDRNLKEFYDIQEPFIFKDEAQSGYYTSVFDRPAMKEAIALAKQRSFQLIVFKEVSRVGRDKQENPAIIGMFEQYGVRVIALNDNYDSLNGENITFDILSVLAEQESKKISARVSSARKQKARRGQWNGDAPIGYKVDKQTKKLTIDPEYKNLPIQIFDLYINSGMGTFKIAEHLNNNGLLTKNGNLWSRNTINRVLNNQAYIGNVVHGARKNLLKREYDDDGKMTKKKVQINTNEKEWTVTEDSHEPIIDKETFYKAQKIMSERGHYQKGRRIRHPLTGILICGECGQGMVAQAREYKGKKYRYYVCKTYHKYGRNACSQANINAEVMEKYALNLLQEEFYTHINNNQYDIHENKQLDLNKLEDEKREINKQIVKLEKDQNALFEQRELFSENQYKKKMLDVKNKIDYLYNQLEIIDNQNKAILNSIDSIKNYSEILDEIKQIDITDLDKLRMVFHEFIKKIRVEKQTDILETKVEFNFQL